MISKTLTQLTRTAALLTAVFLTLAISGGCGDDASTPNDDALTQDTDSPAQYFRVTQTAKSMSEASGQITIYVVLTTAPTNDVTVGLDSDNPMEGQVSVTSLTFTPDNWSTAQSVVVTSVDDNVADGDTTYSIIFTAAQSDDENYAGLVPPAVSITNTDNEEAGITWADLTGPTNEDGGQATFTLVLNSMPSKDVIISMYSDTPSEGVVNTPELTFTPGNWNTPQIVKVTGIDDGELADGDQPFDVVLSISGQDEEYIHVIPPHVPMMNTDNEIAGVITVVANPTTAEDGTQATFTVRLSAMPIGDVPVQVLSSDTTEGMVNLSTLTFTQANWNVPQTVTVTGIDDFVDDGDQQYDIILSFGGFAPVFMALPSVKLTFINTDDDTVGITVEGPAGNTDETGTQTSFSIKLNSEPTADVTINFDSNDKTEGTVSPTSLKFTSTNWDVPVSIELTGVDDEIVDGDQQWAIEFGPVVSSDNIYSAIEIPDITLLNIDDDTDA